MQTDIVCVRERVWASQSSSHRIAHQFEWIGSDVACGSERHDLSPQSKTYSEAQLDVISSLLITWWMMNSFHLNWQCACVWPVQLYVRIPLPPTALHWYVGSIQSGVLVLLILSSFCLDIELHLHWRSRHWSKSVATLYTASIKGNSFPHDSLSSDGKSIRSSSARCPVMIQLIQRLEEEEVSVSERIKCTGWRKEEKLLGRVFWE